MSKPAEGATGPLTTYEDHSGVSTADFKNPYDALLAATKDDPSQLQARYSAHREIRNSQQRSKILSPEFPGVTIDPILLRLEDPTVQPGFSDPRFCFVFWARPPQPVKELIQEIQQKLLDAAPGLWVMPQHNLHTTVLEIAHSKTDSEIKDLLSIARPHISEIVNYPQTRRPRLVKPLVGYDASAIALTFLPAAGEAQSTDSLSADDAYTYHHFRRDVYGMCDRFGIPVASRYVVPSAHLTIGRFIRAEDFKEHGGEGKVDKEKMKALIQKIEEVNAWLREEYWPKDNTEAIRPGGDWVIGQEKGLDCREGQLWYGGGRTVELGQGF